MDPVTDRNNYTVGRMESVELEHPSEEQYGVIVRYPAINHRFWGTIGEGPEDGGGGGSAPDARFLRASEARRRNNLWLIY
jgi:hypothetical protein